MGRTRSEYRREQLDRWTPPPSRPPTWTARSPLATDRARLATLILDAYRGTIDDEGEDHAAALEAVDDWLLRARAPHSTVLELTQSVVAVPVMVAVSFVVEVDGVTYIDPVATAPAHKRRGLARAAVCESLGSLQRHGVVEVGAVITDGNTASERLFTGLGFARVGVWG